MKNLVLVLMLLSATGYAQIEKENKNRPNVILIMTDDQGYGDLSCHGNPILKTPKIDKLYSESIRFTDFHVSVFCTPTRAALMTGNFPGKTGAYRTSSGRTMMHTDEKTIAQLFANEGYATGMFGKWHLGDNAPHRPQDRGFQDVVWHRAGGIGQISDYWENDYFDDTYERNGTYEKFEGYCTDVFFREGKRFIKENQHEPFFLYLPLNAPHGPYNVAEEWAAPYRGNKNVVNPNFYGMIANIDYNVGALRAYLEELDLSENTILIFMTDNGTAAGAKFDGLDSEPLIGYNAGMRGKKSSVYNGGHRVPFFMHWPEGGLTGGKDIENLGAHIDVLPTLSDLCGITIPEGYDPDGISLKPLLDGSLKTLDRSPHIVQFHGGAYAAALPSEPLTFTSIITEDWHLVNNRGEQALYHIKTDPAQRKDVANENPLVVNEFRDAYQPFWKAVSERMTPVRIDIGNLAENPTVLTSQDWYMTNGNPPWNFKIIGKDLFKTTGPWMVEIKHAGRYKITLSQYPKAANKMVIAERAKLEIAGIKKEVKVKKGSVGVVFELTLPIGPSQLKTWLFNEEGKAGGAYFAEIEYLGDGG